LSGATIPATTTMAETTCWSDAKLSEFNFLYGMSSMIKIDDKGLWRNEVAAEIRRLERLLFDLNSLWSDGGYPSYGELSTAAVLVNPEIQTQHVACLVGMRVGGPDGGVSVVKTSRIEVASEAGWVRTKNTLYRLERYQ
jgi:hypothetical protein